jgi:hypothetical protein
MTKKEEFITLVQTAAIVESISRKDQFSKEPKLSVVAAIAVNAAFKVSENKLPNDLVEACEKHIEYVFDNSIPKPKWLLGIL